MMLLRSDDRREERHDLWLAGSTATVAGLVNVCSVMAFFAFGSNITGNVAIFAEESTKGHLHQTSVVAGWLFAFLFGATVANLFVTILGSRSLVAGHSAPLVIEIAVLSVIGIYGEHHYTETLRETEWLVGGLLFAMGCQNGLVASVSKSVVKTTHLTGLMTDLGMELSMRAQKRYRHQPGLRFRLRLRMVILGMYLAGGMLGAFSFLYIRFQALQIGSAILALILIVDLVLLRLGQQKRAADARGAEPG